MKKFSIVLLLTLLSKIVSAQLYEPTWESVDKRATPQWFTDAKFGIFIHWGVFSVPSWAPLEKDGAGVYQRYAEWYWYRLMNPYDKADSLFYKFHKKTYGNNFQYQDFVKDFKAELFSPDEWAKILKSSEAKFEGFTPSIIS